MGVAVGDYDSDGDDDLFVTHLERARPTRSTPTTVGAVFNDRDHAGSGLGTAQPALSPASEPSWLDFDNDGRLDLFDGQRCGEDDPVARASDSGEPYPLRPAQISCSGTWATGRFDDLSAHGGC